MMKKAYTTYKADIEYIFHIIYIKYSLKYKGNIHSEETRLQVTTIIILQTGV